MRTMSRGGRRVLMGDWSERIGGVGEAEQLESILTEFQRIVDPSKNKNRFVSRGKQ